MSHRFATPFWIVVAVVAATNLNFAHANNLSTDAESPSAQIQQMDPNAVRDAGIQQAEQIRQIPDDLRAQGVPVSAEDEAKMNQAADKLATEANQPDFKDKVAAAMKKVDHNLKRAGIDSLKGIGYAGSSVFAVGVAPFMFGADFFSALILGRGPFTDGSKDNWDELAAATGGIGTFYYAYVGLQLTGYVLPGTILASSMGIVVTNVLLCANKEHHGNLELDHYCALNSKILCVITQGSAKGGDIAGKEIHKGLKKALGFIDKPFRKEEPNADPSPAPSAAPSTSPSASPDGC